MGWGGHPEAPGVSSPGALEEVDWLRSRLEILESSLLASSGDGRLLNRQGAHAPRPHYAPPGCQLVRRLHHCHVHRQLALINRLR